MPDVPLHTIEAIVTPDRFEFGAMRIRLPGGWGYWLTPGGSVVTFFVPDEAVPPIATVATGRSLDDVRRAMSLPPLPSPEGEVPVGEAIPMQVREQHGAD